MSDTVVWGIVVLLWFIFGFALGVYWQSRKQDNTRYAGDIEIDENIDDGKLLYSLSLNCEPEELLQHNKVIFHIVAGRV
jgi:hypothetical protein